MSRSMELKEKSRATRNLLHLKAYIRLTALHKLRFAMHYSFDLLSVSVLDSYLYRTKILPRLWQSLQWNQGNAVIIHYVNSSEFLSFLFMQSPYFTTWLPKTCSSLQKQTIWTCRKLKGTDSKLLLLEISICRYFSLVQCLKCVQFHNWLLARSPNGI